VPGLAKTLAIKTLASFIAKAGGALRLAIDGQKRELPVDTDFAPGRKLPTDAFALLKPRFDIRQKVLSLSVFLGYAFTIYRCALVATSVAIVCQYKIPTKK